MFFALELLAVHKQFRAGAGSCLASARVLRGASLTVSAGEVVAITGARGSGKSTVLLCGAGLLRPDAGHVRWYGRAQQPPDRDISLHLDVDDLLGGPRAADSAAHALRPPAVYLVDLSNMIERNLRLERWIVERTRRNHAVLVAGRSENAMAFADRTYVLHGGCLHQSRCVRTRVAEFVDPLRLHV